MLVVEFSLSEVWQVFWPCLPLWDARATRTCPLTPRRPSPQARRVGVAAGRFSWTPEEQVASRAPMGSPPGRMSGGDGTGAASATDEGVVRAIAKAIACVRAWLRVQDAQRTETMPDPRTVADGANVAKTLARASELAHAAPQMGGRHEMRKHAAERLRRVFLANEAAAEQGYANAHLDIEAACDEVSAAFDAWS